MTGPFDARTSLGDHAYDVPLPPVRDKEIETVIGLMRGYGRPLGPSGVLLGTAVVTRANERRVQFVLREMERRGLIRIQRPADRFVDEDIYEVVA